MHWFTPLMATVAGLGLPREDLDRAPPLLPKHVSRDRDRKQSIHDLNQCPCGVPALISLVCENSPAFVGRLWVAL